MAHGRCAARNPPRQVESFHRRFAARENYLGWMCDTWIRDSSLESTEQKRRRRQRRAPSGLELITTIEVANERWSFGGSKMSQRVIQTVGAVLLMVALSATAHAQQCRGGGQRPMPSTVASTVSGTQSPL